MSAADTDCTCTSWCDVRWFCPCGRFVPESSLKSGDDPDPFAYYGFTGWTTAECSRCGTVEPECRPVKENPWLDPACAEHGESK
jgi:hypothetical protein